MGFQGRGATLITNWHFGQLWGEEHLEIGRREVKALSRDCAAGLTAGARKKSYPHTDPNEDVVALIQSGPHVLLVCADGHNGKTSSHVAVEVLVERLTPIPSPESLSDDDLVDLWLDVNEAVLDAGMKARQRESRTTPVTALVSGARSDGSRWAIRFLQSSIRATIQGCSGAPADEKAALRALVEGRGTSPDLGQEPLGDLIDARVSVERG
ncbi:MAG: family protein phosphatase [Solirubrobacteraceae bacterium]|nr:family protein phosphatase [Solirubrobacteraceae bacterium]